MALYSKDAVGDLVLLETIDEGSILSTLKRRYAKDLIYTHIGNVLLSVNPFKEINGLYSDHQIETYRGRYIYECAPHIYSLAEDTYRSLCTEGKDQCVIISGESGAGKTEASKKIMQYIAAVTGSGPDIERVKNHILASNPVLESFGNAKTQRNNNSSRFGKYMTIDFDYKGDPVGGRIANFLLEKSRVISQLPDERSFHVFYMMLSGITHDAQRQALSLLSSPADYNYLNKNKCYHVDRMDDKEEWRDCQESMVAIGMTQEEIMDILKVLSAILWLGQIEFAPETADKSKIVNQQPIEIVSKLLGCDAKLLAQGMVSRTFSANNSSVLTPLNVDAARYTRDALAKTIYFRLFDFIVYRINQVLETPHGAAVSASASSKQKAKSLRTIGVLDIYGFEIFQSNSFEQFNINFVNEKLQQIFIEKTIKAEQEEYSAENIQWTPVDFFNNKVVCDLIESKKPAGIIAYLDEECLLGKGTDFTFLDKLDSNLKSHKHFARAMPERGKAGAAASSSSSSSAATEFIVKHYAGDVNYSVVGFLDKNKDLVWKDLLQIGESSNNKIMGHSTMFPKGCVNQASLARPVTAGTNFKTQVGTLMETLSACQPHYIRCLKPNDLKKSGVFADDMMLNQVRYLGLLENVRVRRAGFAFRQEFPRFVARYKMLSEKTWPSSTKPVQEQCREILSSLNLVEGKQYQLGLTKIFIRQPISLFTLEELRERKLQLLATLIQKIYRSYRTRKYFREMREKSLGLFGRNKLRRRGSVRRFFVGDYLGLSGNPIISKMLAKYKESGVKSQAAGTSAASNILFVDECEKINRKSKTQRRILLLTQNAIYNLGEGKYKENRRILIKDVTRISVSPYADNYVVIHVAKEYDYVVTLERKTEFLTALADAYKSLTGNQLVLKYETEIHVSTKEKKAQIIAFMKNDSVNGVSHAPDPNIKDRLNVTVGKLDVVNDSYLKALEPVVMKRTDPALKPKPGYVARNEPVKVRGISISGGQGQKLIGATTPTASSSTSSSSPKAKDLWSRAIEDFTGADNRELSFKKGDFLRILSQDESGWWSAASVQGALGYVPSTYVEIVASGPPSITGERRPSMHQAPLPQKRW